MTRLNFSLKTFPKATALATCLISSFGLLTETQASSISMSCADAYGEYFLEGDQVFGRTSEAYFPVEIVQTVLISRQNEKCTNKSGQTFDAFNELSVVKVKGIPEDRDEAVEISFLCQEFGDTYPIREGEDTTCVKTDTLRQGPFTEAPKN